MKTIKVGESLFLQVWEGVCVSLRTLFDPARRSCYAGFELDVVKRVGMATHRKEVVML